MASGRVKWFDNKKGFGFISGETGTDILIQQQDGKIVVGGVTSPGGINDYCLLRFTTAGVLDPTWGTGGVVTVASSLAR